MMSNRTSYRVNVTDVGLDMVIVFSSPIGGWDGLFKIMPDPTAPATQYEYYDACANPRVFLFLRITLV